MQWFRVALLMVLLLLAGTGLVVERHLHHLNQTLQALTIQQTVAGLQAMEQTELLRVLSKPPQRTTIQWQLQP